MIDRTRFRLTLVQEQMDSRGNWVLQRKIVEQNESIGDYGHEEDTVGSMLAMAADWVAGFTGSSTGSSCAASFCMSFESDQSDFLDLLRQIALAYRMWEGGHEFKECVSISINKKKLVSQFGNDTNREESAAGGAQ